MHKYTFRFLKEMDNNNKKNSIKIIHELNCKPKNLLSLLLSEFFLEWTFELKI
jgi:hypothetical protein